MKTNQKTNAINRRAALRSLVVSIGAMSVGRAILACSESEDENRRVTPSAKGGSSVPPSNQVPPNDQDEHVPGTSAPVNAGDDVKVPNQLWETRVKQLEAEQARIYGRTTPFARGDTKYNTGDWAGKENSHEPKASIVTVDGKRKVQVVVEHVMGKSALDGGAPVVDASTNALDSGALVVDASTDAADPGARDAGDAGDASKDAATGGGNGGGVGAIVHYITTIWIRALVDGVDTVIGIWEFASTDKAPPTVQFALPANATVTAVTAHEWCTLHGIWKAPALSL